MIPGFYSGDYGEATRPGEVGSELILEANGTFRYFGLDKNSPWISGKGEWVASGNILIWKRFSLCSVCNGTDYYQWDSLPDADTSYLRGVSEYSFERLEITRDALWNLIARWARYRVDTPESAVSDGVYEFTRIYPDYYDSSKLITEKGVMELRRGGGILRSRGQNGEPVEEIESGWWIQSGSFLVAGGNRLRNYVDSLQAFSAWSDYPAGHEFVIRIRDVQADSFQFWLPYPASYPDTAHWISCRRAP